MIHKTLQAAGYAAATVNDTAAPSGLALARTFRAARRALGFAITASGFAVIAAHALAHIGG